MAALMTSVIDNPKKLSEYILTSRSMGIELLPPDINEGHSGFAVSDGKIRYALTAIKSIGRPEFMAALMTSVIDNPKKLSEYILTSRSMGIELLPPDINEGHSGFAVSDGKIRYALTAIKSIGRPVIDGIVEERKLRGPFSNLKDFITRMADKDLNKRAIENFIKAGALDSLGGTRKQFMSVYVPVSYTHLRAHET